MGSMGTGARTKERRCGRVTMERIVASDAGRRIRRGIEESLRKKTYRPTRRVYTEGEWLRPLGILTVVTGWCKWQPC